MDTTRIARSGHRLVVSVVEFFCGLGGVSEAIRQLNLEQSELLRLHVQRAIDIDRQCGEVYEHNFGVAVDSRTIESMDLHSLLANEDASVWWMSPPCQPYCRRGRRDATHDRRCDSIRSISGFLRRSTILPRCLALENVPEFATSEDGLNLIAILQSRGYAVWDGLLCSTQFGIANLRRRYYLIARRDVAQVRSPSTTSPNGKTCPINIRDVLENQPAKDLWVNPVIVAKYGRAMDIIDPDDESSWAACFGSGYGKSVTRSGSYLRCGEGIRHFSPLEISRLLGFSSRFEFPDTLSTRRRWKMLGNSVSIPVVKAVLRSCVE